MDPLSIVRGHVATYVGESGKHPSDPEVLEAINEARRIIYPVGDWEDTTEMIALQSMDGIITLPAWADVIREAYHGHGSLQIESGWYERLGCGNFDHLRGRRLGTLIDLGARFATFRPYDRNFRIRVISVDPEDKGVEITFHAISEYGEPLLLTRTLSNAWEPIVSNPSSDKWVNRITACNKPVTKDRVFVYIYDPVRKFQALCAIYEATDVNPQLRRYRTPVMRGPILAKVKRKFVELTDDRQLVDIHTDALIHLIQGITSRKNRDPQTYAMQVKSAQNLLDKQIEDKQPLQSRFIRMHPEFHDTNLGF